MYNFMCLHNNTNTKKRGKNMDCGYKLRPRGMVAGWEPKEYGPVLGGALGSITSCYVMQEGDLYRMWFSWQLANCIAYTESKDGVNWELPKLVLTPRYESDWEIHEVSHPTLVYKDGLYHMWYTGRVFPSEITAARCCIGYAVSKDGIHWEKQPEPVLIPQEAWENIAVMYPHVLWEEDLGCYRMWYSAGRITDPDAIGVATSKDGIHWERYTLNPVFTPNSDKYWENAKTFSCFVLPKQEEWYTMFYVGADGDGVLSIGLARSKDGVTDWQRNPLNPVISGTDGSWDWRSTGKPSVLKVSEGYTIWYKGCNARFEEIGIATHKGTDLGFSSVEGDAVDERGVDNGTGKNNLYVREKLPMGLFPIPD